MGEMSLTLIVHPSHQILTPSVPLLPPYDNTTHEWRRSIHLRRSLIDDEIDDEDDHDYAAPRKRSRSVGEELWHVHMIRSQGSTEDPEDTHDEQQPKGNTISAPQMKEENQLTTKAGRPKEGMRLRDGRILTQ